MLHRTIMQEALTDRVATTDDVSMLAGIEHDSAVEGYLEASQDVDTTLATVEENDALIAGIESLLSDLDAANTEAGIAAGTEAMATTAGNILLAPYGVTAAGVESLKEVLANAWKASLEFIKKLLKNIQMFFVKHVALVGRTKKKAVALAEAIKDVKGKPKEKTVDIGKNVSRLTFGGKYAGDIPGNIEELAEAVKSITRLNPVTKASLEAADIILDSMTKPKGDVTAATWPAMVKVIEQYMSYYGLKPTGKNSDGLKLYESPEFLGGKKVALTYLSSGTPVVVMTDVKVGKIDSSVPALDSAEILRIANAVSELCDEVIQMKDVNENMTASSNKIMEVGNKLDAYLKSNGDKLSKETEKTAKSGGRIIKQMVTNLQLPVFKLSSHAVSVSSSALTLAEKSKANLA